MLCPWLRYIPVHQAHAFKKKSINYLDMCVCVCMSLRAPCARRYSWRPEGVESPGTGVTGI